MTHVTTAILMEHTGHTKATILKWLKRTKTPFKNYPGGIGVRVKLTDANKLIGELWPTCGPIDPSKLILTRSTEK